MGEDDDQRARPTDARLLPEPPDLGRQGAPEAGARVLAHQHQRAPRALAEGLRQGAGLGRRHDPEARAQLAPGVVGGHPVDADQRTPEGPRAPLDVAAQRIEDPARGLHEDDPARAGLADQLVELPQALALRRRSEPPGNSR